MPGAKASLCCAVGGGRHGRLPFSMDKLLDDPEIQDWMEPVDFGRGLTFEPERLLKEPPYENLAQTHLREVNLYVLCVGVGVEAAKNMDTLPLAHEESGKAPVGKWCGRAVEIGGG